MINILSVRLPGGYMERLKRRASEKRLPVATIVRNVVLDWLDEEEQTA